MKTDTTFLAGTSLPAVPVAHGAVYPAAPARSLVGREATKHPGRGQAGRKMDVTAAARVAREHTRGRHAG